MANTAARYPGLLHSQENCWASGNAPKPLTTANQLMDGSSSPYKL